MQRPLGLQVSGLRTEMVSRGWIFLQLHSMVHIPQFSGRLFSTVGSSFFSFLLLSKFSDTE